MQRLQDLRRQVKPSALGEGAGGVEVEPGQPEPDRVVPRDIGQQPGDLVGDVGLGRAHGQDHHDGQPTQLGDQRPQQCAGRLVGPLRVVDGHDARTDLSEEGGAGPGQPEDRGVRVGRFGRRFRSGQQPGEQVGVPLPKFGTLSRRQARDQISDGQSDGQQAGEVAALGAAAPAGAKSLVVGRRPDGRRERRLADPRFTVDHDHPPVAAASRVEDFLGEPKLGIPADDRCPGGRRRLRRARCVQARFLAEQVDLEAAKLRAEVDSELVVQHLPGPADGGQGIGLPIGAVQRQRQQAVPALPQRIGRDEAFELGNLTAVLAQGERTAHPPLHGE